MKFSKILVASLLFILIIGMLVCVYRIDSLATQKVHDLLSQRSFGDYTLTFDDVDVEILNSLIEVKGVKVRHIEGDDRYRGRYNVEGNIETIKLSGVNLRSLFKGEFRIRKVDLSGDRLILTENEEVSQSPNQRKTSKPQTEIKVISMDMVHIRMAKVIGIQKHRRAWSMQNVDVDVQGFSYGDRIVKNRNGWDLENIHVKVAGANLLNNKVYNVQLEKLTYDSGTKLVELLGFCLKPKMSRRDYSASLEFENDLFDIKVERIKLPGLDWKNILERQQLVMGTVDVENPNVWIYRDKRVADGPFKHKPLPGSLVKKIPIPVKIEGIRIRGGKLAYEEQQANMDAPGLVFLDLNEIDLTSLNTLEKKDLQSGLLGANVKAKLMGKANLNAQFTFYLHSDVDSFHLDGAMGEVGVRAFNKLCENMVGVHLRQGILKSTRFNIIGTDLYAGGKMWIDYEGLKVDVLNKKKKNSKALGLVANGLLVEENIPGTKKYREGHISFVRDQNRGFPNFLWKSVASALVPIVVPMAESKAHKRHRKGVVTYRK